MKDIKNLIGRELNQYIKKSSIEDLTKYLAEIGVDQENIDNSAYLAKFIINNLPHFRKHYYNDHNGKRMSGWLLSSFLKDWKNNAGESINWKTFYEDNSSYKFTIHEVDDILFNAEIEEE